MVLELKGRGREWGGEWGVGGEGGEEGASKREGELYECKAKVSAGQSVDRS